MKAILDGRQLRAPAPGWFRYLVLADHLIAPDDVIGELDQLGRITRIVAPRVHGIAKLSPGDARRAVSYGDVLLTLGDGVTTVTDPSEMSGEATEVTPSLVFRAPSSGRYYGRPSPDKPAFVTVGGELVPGATVCLLEVMKTFHRVHYDGARARVSALLVPEGADVNAGDPLLALDPL